MRGRFGNDGGDGGVDTGGRGRLAARVLGGALVLSILLAGAPGLPVRAAFAGSDEGMLSIGKNAVYGALTGLLLGGVVALVSDEDSRGDAIRWGVVIGTFGGVAYGIYDLSTGDDRALTAPEAADHFALRMTRPGVVGSARAPHFRPANTGLAQRLAQRPGV